MTDMAKIVNGVLPNEQITEYGILDELLNDFSDKLFRGSPLTMSSYLERCTSQEMRVEFRSLANMIQLLAANELSH